MKWLLWFSRMKYEVLHEVAALLFSYASPASADARGLHCQTVHWLPPQDQKQEHLVGCYKSHVHLDLHSAVAEPFPLGVFIVWCVDIKFADLDVHASPSLR